MFENTSEPGFPLPTTAVGMCNATVNGTDCENRGELDTVDYIAYKIVGPTVVGIGLLGNVLNLIVLTRPSFKGVTYTYLIGLACSDIGVLLCAVPMMIRQTNSYSQRSWIASIFFAHMEYPLSNIFMASSIFIVVCLTVDRFAAICTPTKFKSVHTPQISKTAILVCYLLATMVSLPLGLLKYLCVQDSTTTMMMMSESGLMDETFPTIHPQEYLTRENTNVTKEDIWKVYIVLEQIISRFGPGFILTVLNAMIIRQFRIISRKRREMRSGGGGNGNGNGCLNGGEGAGGGKNTEQLLLRGEEITKRSYKEEKRLVVLLMSIVLLFFITTTPVAFLHIFFSDDYKCHFGFQVFRALANDLELCNFALNFYIYFLCSKEFRKKFLSFFQFIIPRKTKGDLQTITLPEISQIKTKSTNIKVPHSV